MFQNCAGFLYHDVDKETEHWPKILIQWQLAVLIKHFFILQSWAGEENSACLMLFFLLHRNGLKPYGMFCWNSLTISHSIGSKSPVSTHL